MPRKKKSGSPKHKAARKRSRAASEEKPQASKKSTTGAGKIVGNPTGPPCRTLGECFPCRSPAVRGSLRKNVTMARIRRMGAIYRSNLIEASRAVATMPRDF